MSESRYTEQYLPLILEDVSIEEIPRQAERTPDFVAKFGGATFLIEEKEKLDDSGFANRRRETLLRGDIHNFAIPKAPDNRLDGVFSRAASQIGSESAPAHDYGLVWFTASGSKAEAVFDQCIATLYGTVEIFGIDLPNLVTCYFFRNSSFFRHAQVLDGVIVAQISADVFSCKLCINPLSPRYSSFRTTQFVSAFKKHDAVEDPISHERDGIAFVMDTDLDRRDEGVLLSYLERKYSIARIQPIILSILGGESLVPSRDQED